MAFVGILACLVANGPQRRARRSVVIGVAAALVVLIGFSRVFLSVHYLTDVLAGGLVGGLWLTAGSALVPPAQSSAALSDPAPDSEST